jgi:flagellar biogenesis protein FliO
MEGFGQLFSVIGVLSLLGASLWWLRSKGYTRFKGSAIGGGSARQLQSLERLPLTAQHSLHLVRVLDRTVLIAVSPTGCSILDGATEAAERFQSR